jgi:hypothetical protein
MPCVLRAALALDAVTRHATLFPLFAFVRPVVRPNLLPPPKRGRNALALTGALGC